MLLSKAKCNVNTIETELLKVWAACNVRTAEKDSTRSKVWALCSVKPAKAWFHIVQDTIVHIQW